MAEENDDDQQALKPIEDSLEVDTEVAGEEMDASSDTDYSLDIIVETPKSEKSKPLLPSSSPTPTVPLLRVSPSSPRVLAFEELLGYDFPLHRIFVNPGEDLIKVMRKFNHHYKHRNICIISASGTASKVEIDGSPNPIQYEGQLQLLTLSIRRIFNDDPQNRKEETLLASLSTGFGTVVGGILVGQFIASSFIHIIAGTFKRMSMRINIPSVVPENGSENPNISSGFEDGAGTDDQTMQQPETDPNNAETDEFVDIIN